MKRPLVLVCLECRTSAPYPAPRHDGHHALIVRRKDRDWAIRRFAPRVNNDAALA